MYKTLTLALLTTILSSYNQPLTAQDWTPELSIHMGLTNIDGHLPEVGKKGPLVEFGFGLTKRLSSKESGFIVQGMGTVSYSSFRFQRTAEIFFADAQLLEVGSLLGLGYQFKGLRLIPNVAINYALMGNFRGGAFLERPSEVLLAEFDLTYNQPFESSAGRVGVADDNRLYLTAGLQLQYAITDAIILGATIRKTATNADFSFLSAAPCSNGNCPEFEETNTFGGGFGTKDRATATISLTYVFQQ